MLCWGVTVAEASLLFLTSLSSERHTPALWMGGRNAVCVCVCVCVCWGSPSVLPTGSHQVECQGHFPGGPVVKTPCSSCRGFSLCPGS